jgi:hypothetical protein
LSGTCKYNNNNNTIMLSFLVFPPYQFSAPAFDVTVSQPSAAVQD